MDPVVAKFLASYPTWDDVMEVQHWMEDNLPKPNEKEWQLDKYFSDGIYVRSLPVPAGSFIIGKRHAKGHVTMLAVGDATIITEDGQDRIKAPHIWIDAPGVKRAIYTHADCVFVTMHGTHTTDPDELERELVVPEPERIKQEDVL